MKQSLGKGPRLAKGTEGHHHVMPTNTQAIFCARLLLLKSPIIHSFQSLGL